MTAHDSNIPYASPSYDYELRARDDSHLKILVVCTYIWGGLLAAFSLFALFHVGFGIAILSGALDSPDGSAPPFLGWMLILAGSLTILLGETMAGLLLYSAYKMSRRQARIFSIVMAGISCLSIPLGTVLGVFTILVLSRESVRAQYEQGAGETAFAVAGIHPAWRG